jgi:Peptidase A4 family
MKRLMSLTAAGVMCAGALLSTTGIAGASTSGGASAQIQAQPGGPMVRVKGGTGLPTLSENWSGYAVQSKKPFTSVSGTWVVPAIKCNTGKPHRMVSNWVGLDGFTDQTVEQDGTSGRCSGPGWKTPVYVAWYEMFPAASVNAFHIHAGDVMQASVNYANGQFELTIADQTIGKAAAISATCSQCARSSAEWIIERPAYCNSTFTNCALFALANYGTSVMLDNKASLNGGPAMNFAHFNPNPIYMIQPLKHGFISLDTVGGTTGDSYIATWDRSGTIVPIQLGPNR